MKKQKVLLLMLILTINTFAQNSFLTLDSIINRCSLDSSLFYVKKQSNFSLTNREKLQNELYYVTYYSSVNLEDSAIEHLNFAIQYSDNKESDGLIQQAKGKLYEDKLEYKKAKNAYFLAQSLMSDKKNQAEVNYNLYSVCRKLKQVDSSWFYLYKSKNLHKDGESRGIKYATVLNSIGIKFFYKARYDSAYSYYIKSLRIYEKESALYDVIRTKELIGTFFYSQGKYEEGIECYKKSYNLAIKVKDIKAQCSILCNIGVGYIKTRELKLALNAFQTVSEIAKVNNFFTINSVALTNLAFIYAEEFNYVKAIKLQKLSREIDLKKNDLEGLSYSSYYLAKYYLKSNKKNLAKQYLWSVLNLNKGTDNLEMVKSSYKLLSELYEVNQDSSLFYYKEYSRVKDSIGKFEVKKVIEKLSLEYKSELSREENKRLKLELVKKENELLMKYQSEVIDKDRRVLTFVIGGGIIFILLGMVYVFYVRNKVQSREIELSKSKAERQEIEKKSILKRLEVIQGNIVEKNETIEKLEKYMSSSNASKSILESLTTDNDWAKFMIDFELLYPNYLMRLNSKSNIQLSKNDYRIASLLQLKLTNQEMADVLNISLSGVKMAKSRFKQKLKG